MSKLIITFFSLSILLLAGCTTLSPTGKAYKNFTSCIKDIESNPSVKMVYQELIPNSKSSPELRYALLNSMERVQDNQKQPLGIYIMLGKECQNKFIIELSGTPSLQKIWQKIFARANSQLNLLFRGDINIGEYNTTDLADAQQFGLELQKAYQGMIQQNAVDQLNAYNLMGGSSSTLILPPAPANRTIPSMGSPPPAYVPPVQTFCQPNAGGFSCITR